jgi:hypothetical protein
MVVTVVAATIIKIVDVVVIIILARIAVQSHLFNILNILAP